MWTCLWSMGSFIVLVAGALVGIIVAIFALTTAMWLRNIRASFGFGALAGVTACITLMADRMFEDTAYRTPCLRGASYWNSAWSWHALLEGLSTATLIGSLSICIICFVLDGQRQSASK